MRPVINSPSIIIKMPPVTLKITWYSISNAPIKEEEAPKVIKIVEKPKINAMVLNSVLKENLLFLISSKLIPEIIDT